VSSVKTNQQQKVIDEYRSKEYNVLIHGLHQVSQKETSAETESVFDKPPAGPTNSSQCFGIQQRGPYSSTNFSSKLGRFNFKV